jgi:hypothetical protein
MPNHEILPKHCGSCIFYLNEIWYNHRLVWHKHKDKVFAEVDEMLALFTSVKESLNYTNY